MGDIFEDLLWKAFTPVLLVLWTLGAVLFGYAVLPDGSLPFVYQHVPNEWRIATDQEMQTGIDLANKALPGFEGEVETSGQRVSVYAERYLVSSNLPPRMNSDRRECFFMTLVLEPETGDFATFATDPVYCDSGEPVEFLP